MRTRAATFLFLALSLPATAQDFGTELSLGFGYLGGKVDNPVVAIDGVASPSFAYREDSSGRSLEVAATRYFGGVPDDGATPRALLPFVARRSSLTAGVGLSTRSRDSYGVSRGAALTVESRLGADWSATQGALDGTWFARPGWALHATMTAESSRETQAWSSVQTPSATSLSGSTAPKRDRLAGSLGLLARPTPELAVEAAVVGATATEKTTLTYLPGFFGGTPSTADARTDSSTLGVALSARLLLANRRVALEGSASYAPSHSDGAFTAPVAQALSTGHQTARAVAGAATWFATRELGLTLGGSYGTSELAQGGDVERPAADGRTVVWSAGARWFPRPAASVALDWSRTTNDTVTPPDSPSFQRYVATDDRVTLTAALRF